MDEQPLVGEVEETLDASGADRQVRAGSPDPAEPTADIPESGADPLVRAGSPDPAGAPEEPVAVEAEPAEVEVEAEAAPAPEVDETALKAVIEAIVYVAEEPVTPAQVANSVGHPEDLIKRLLDELAASFADAGHGIMIREVAGGYKMATKPEHHEAVRAFAKSLKPPLKLSLAALETLATIAYKQPITAPEIMEIRGVQGAGVLKTLLDRKLIQAGGRKNVIGRPILYRTTKEFLVQFGLKDLAELPTLKEFEELRRLAASEDETPVAADAQPEAEAAQPAAEPQSATDAQPETEAAQPTTEPQPPPDAQPETEAAQSAPDAQPETDAAQPAAEEQPAPEPQPPTDAPPADEAQPKAEAAEPQPAPEPAPADENA